jgi:effector-binding domain-containing protein
MMDGGEMMKAQWIVLIVAGGVAVVATAAFLFLKKGPDLSSYLPLKEPRIASMADERVLEVKFSGPADTVIQKAYGVLFKAYYGLKGAPKGPLMRPPKARYALPAMNDPVAAAAAAEKLGNFLAHAWTGSVAVPIPADVAVPAAVPAGAPAAEGLAASEGTWAYGEVAEILHLGSYETEAPTIERLTRFIEEQGRRIVGDHEEEYLKGPGMGRVDPKDYWTIIRYRVAKAR